MTGVPLWVRCDLCADAGATVHIPLDPASEAVFNHAQAYHPASMAAVPLRFISGPKAIASPEFAQWCAENMTLVAPPAEAQP